MQLQQKPKALRKQKKPISSSTKLLKRQQQDAPDQSSQFKRKCCAERNPSISSLIKGLANSYRSGQTKKNDENTDGTSKPTENVWGAIVVQLLSILWCFSDGFCKTDGCKLEFLDVQL